MALALKLIAPALALLALLATLIVAALIPMSPDGLKLTLIVQFALGISVPQPELAWKSLLMLLALVGVMLSAPTLRSMVPVLVTLMACAMLTVPKI